MKKIWLVFDRSKKIEFFIFSFYMSVNTVMEVFSISLLLPIIVSLTDNNFFDLYPKFSLFLNFFKRNSHQLDEYDSNPFWFYSYIKLVPNI